RTAAVPDAVEHAALRAFLRRRLGWPDPLPEVRAEKIASEDKDGFTATFWLLQTEPGIRLPGVLITPKKGTGKAVLVSGRDPGAVAQALKAGSPVFAFDPRGT